MVFIERDNPNTFVLRLESKRTSPDSYFLWELTNIFDKSVIYFMLTDDSSFQCDYNLFTLVESPSGSIVGGIDVPLSLKGGQYEYKLYESTELSLDPTYIIGSYIEKDMLLVEIEKTVNTASSEANNIYY